MESTSRSLDAALGARLRTLRSARKLSLDLLAEMSGVSRSMISLVERGAASPTAYVLDKLAAALGVTLASLFAEEPHSDASPVARRKDQMVWRDPGTGYERRNLSPPGFPSPIELVEVLLPAEGRVAYESSARSVTIHQQLWILEGEIELTQGEARFQLAAGDCLAKRVDGPNAYHNPGRTRARYLVALALIEGRAGPTTNRTRLLG